MESATIRVAVSKVDQLINLVGELVITQAMLAQNSQDLDTAVYQQLLAGLADLDRNTRDLQESVMSIRMIPMSIVFSRFPRMLRDLANKLGKKVDLVTLGEATELDMMGGGCPVKKFCARPTNAVSRSLSTRPMPRSGS